MIGEARHQRKSSSESKQPTSPPFVFRAGSLCSPSVFSPSSERDPLLDSIAGDQASLIPTVPDTTSSRHMTNGLPLFSPSEVAPSHLDSAMEMPDLTFAAAIPGDGRLPTPPALKPAGQLRLPSFDVLGIAVRHPDDNRFEKAVLHPMGPCPPLLREDDCHPTFPFSAKPNLHSVGETGSNVVAHVQQAVLTPPAENTLINLRSPRDSVSSSIAPNETVEQGGSPNELCPSDDATPTQGPSGGSGTLSGNEIGQDDWLGEATESIVSALAAMPLSGNSMKVLSHALPSPSIPGHVFPLVINDTRTHLPPSPLVWVNLLHAVPGRFNLDDLPTSPPSTPGAPLGEGDDYFATKMFESAVPAVDYEQGKSLTTPQAIAAPCSINLSIVERYIPPTSSNEFAGMFSVAGPSLLVDRLVELTKNGTLLFIYPTRQGAETFVDEYLGPVLDPHLRSMVVVNNFSADLSATIGGMPAASTLFNYDTMHRRITELCNTLNGSSSAVRQRLHGIESSFEIVYADRREVVLDPQVWANWWIKQEKSRVRRAVSQYFRTASRAPTNPGTTPTQVVQEILDGVAARSVEAATPAPIEIGVFVIQRRA